MSEQGDNRFDGSGSSETVDEIIEATYRALSKHGYPETTIARIAAEFDKSKSLLYYHYDSKDELLEDFFGFLCDRLEEDLADHSDEDPHEQLLALLDRILPSASNDEQFQFRQAYFEIRAQAPHNRAYQEKISRSDELVLNALTETIERGIESGRYRDVDASQRAELIFSSLMGIIERATTLEDRALLERNREALTQRIEHSLLATADETEATDSTTQSA
ncbi:TetR/AcrR family transcriptional regulator [Halobacteria archaeon AArc-dxtr1]|nr:TetR/AcrR family transcriptional regulator [Halobacteria archaeon AArc-dxtr1]